MQKNGNKLTLMKRIICSIKHIHLSFTCQKNKTMTNIINKNNKLSNLLSIFQSILTGRDEVAIDPKHKQPYSIRIPAVVLTVNNNAMSFSDRSSRVSRRRVIFNSSEVVPENACDPLLRDKIAAELPVIIRHLLHRFGDPQAARRLLAEQQKSAEELDIKRGTDSLINFCGYLVASHETDDLLISNAESVPFNPQNTFIMPTSLI